MAVDTFSNSDRRQILSILSKNGEMSAGEILNHFDFAFPALSRHLKLLMDGDLVSVRKDQNTRYYSLNKKGILKINDDMNQIFADSFEFKIKTKDNSFVTEVQNSKSTPSKKKRGLVS